MKQSTPNINDLIIDYLGNSLSDNEKDILFQWINKSVENLNEFDIIKYLWELNETETKNTKGNWNKFNDEITHRNKTNRIIKYSLGITAACILILFSILPFTINEKYTTVLTANNNSFLTDTLGNGCIVYLYPGSELKQQNSYFPKTETKYSFSGNGFFIIPENLENILINVGEANIEATSSAFRLNSCTQEKNFSVTVESGSLQLTSEKNDNKIVKIKAGEQGFYSCSQKTIWKNINHKSIYLIYQPNIIDL